MSVLDAGMGHVYVALFRTADGGASWEILVDPHTSTDLQACGKTGMAFRTDQTGWVTFDCGGRYDIPFLDRTADGGSTWGTLELPPPEADPDLYGQGAACWPHSPTLFEPGVGVLALECARWDGDTRSTEAYLYSTSDGGVSWETGPYPGGKLTLIDRDTGWALGRQIHRTTDGGRSWTLVKEVNWDGQFSFLNGELGWAVARAEEKIALVKTTDGCRTWDEIAPQVAPH
jgi:photosystem II stability/assembly factor-like uncharacterized protein